MRVIRSIFAIVVSCATNWILYIGIGVVLFLIHATFQFSSHWDQQKYFVNRNLIIGGSISVILFSSVGGILASRLAPYAKISHTIFVAIINVSIFLSIVWFQIPTQDTTKLFTIKLSILVSILAVIGTIFGGCVVNHLPFPNNKRHRTT